MCCMVTWGLSLSIWRGRERNSDTCSPSPAEYTGQCMTVYIHQWLPQCWAGEGRYTGQCMTAYIHQWLPQCWAGEGRYTGQCMTAYIHQWLPQCWTGEGYSNSHSSTNRQKQTTFFPHLQLSSSIPWYTFRCQKCWPIRTWFHLYFTSVHRSGGNPRSSVAHFHLHLGNKEDFMDSCQCSKWLTDDLPKEDWFWLVQFISTA